MNDCHVVRRYQNTPHTMHAQLNLSSCHFPVDGKGQPPVVSVGRVHAFDRTTIEFGGVCWSCTNISGANCPVSDLLDENPKLVAPAKALFGSG